MDLYQQFLRCF